MSWLILFADSPNLSGLARRYFWTASVVTLLALSTGVLEGVGVGLLIPLLSTFTKDLGAGRQSGVVGLVQRFAGNLPPHQRVVLVSLVILACMLLKSGLQIVANHFRSWVDGKIGHEIRCRLADRLHQVGYFFYLTEDPARLLNILSSESWKASDAVRIVLSRIAEAAGIFVFSVLLIIVSWKLTLLVLLGGLIARSAQRGTEIKLRVLSEKSVSANQHLADRMLFAVFAARLIRLFHSHAEEQDRFERSSDSLRRTNLTVENLSGTLGPLLEAMHGLLFVIVLLVAVFTGVSLPVLAAFLVLMNRLQPHLRAFEEAGAALASSAAHFREVEWLLESRDKPKTPAGQLPCGPLRDCIEFDKVTFEYRGRSEAALQDVSFVLRQGRSTALIGNSGAGKSTLVNLLCRLFEPTSGVIKIDGQPLADIRTGDWLNCVAIAGQDIDLIDATIAENIAYGRPGIDDMAIDKALRAAGADFIDDLPLGLETLVGSQGLSLSGGQRQRIGIARALARQPGILIFDEATNAVDSPTEEGIIKTLQCLSSTTTLLVISHRRSTVEFCDDMVVLDRGRVVKTGPFSLQDYASSLSASAEDAFSPFSVHPASQ